VEFNVADRTEVIFVEDAEDLQYCSRARCIIIGTWRSPSKESRSRILMTAENDNCLCIWIYTMNLITKLKQMQLAVPVPLILAITEGCKNVFSKYATSNNH